MRHRALIVTALIVLSGCGKQQFPYFAAYASNALSPFGEYQPVSLGVLTKIDANYLYFGDPASYDGVTSSFHPQMQGLYWVDEQVEWSGTYTDAIVVNTRLNYNDAVYLDYDHTYSFPAGKSVNQSAPPVQSYICFNGTTDHVEAYITVSCASGKSDCVKDLQILSHKSQFEGHYIGPCNGHN